jgi:small subunit ribosomal protein S16
MLKIRMQRVGRINQPAFRIVVVEHTASPKAGKFVDKVGTYNPKSKERTLDEAKIKHWISVGAQPSATVHNMLISVGIIQGKKINVLPKFVEKKEEAAPAESPASVPEVSAVETPTVEAEPTTEEAKTEAPATQV